jgi:beta-phosphoglucomutase family hydrolase
MTGRYAASEKHGKREMNFGAAIFDMDGVITNTAVVHASAWKSTFDAYLRFRHSRFGEPFREFTGDDYRAFVDGRPRYAGVDAFLRSRGLRLPLGHPNDDPDAETVCGLGNRKNEIFNRVLDQGAVEVYASTVELIEQLRGSGVKVGVATSSRNCVRVLESAGIVGLFEARVDGMLSAQLGLKGKPEPDIFLFACEQLGVNPERAVVAEDAVSGVQAGARGHFGLVVGVARENNADELRTNGADIVVRDLSEINVQQIDSWFKTESAGRHDRHIKIQRVSRV